MYLRTWTVWCHAKYQMTMPNAKALSCVAPSRYCHLFRIILLELVLSFYRRRMKTVCRAAATFGNPSVVYTANNLREPSSESLFSFPHILASLWAVCFKATSTTWVRKHHLRHTDAQIHLLESLKWQNSLSCLHDTFALSPGKRKRSTCLCTGWLCSSEPLTLSRGNSLRTAALCDGAGLRTLQVFSFSFAYPSPPPLPQSLPSEAAYNSGIH